MATELELHGKNPTELAVEGYESPEEYSGQGDDRMVRYLSFTYTTSYEDAAGNEVIQPMDAKTGDVLTLEQMGLIALEKGERSHAFYTTDERKAVEAGKSPDASALELTAGGTDVASLGEYELAEYIKGNNPEGKELTVQQTIDLAGTDKDMAHRLLQAENIATDGEPRKGVETGLTAIIEG